MKIQERAAGNKVRVTIYDSKTNKGKSFTIVDATVESARKLIIDAVNKHEDK